MIQGGHGSHSLVKAPGGLRVCFMRVTVLGEQGNGTLGFWESRVTVWCGKLKAQSKGNFLAGHRQRQTTGKAKVRVN